MSGKNKNDSDDSNKKEENRIYIDFANDNVDGIAIGSGGESFMGSITASSHWDLCSFLELY